MKFVSVRATSGSDEEYSFESSVLGGYAKDGGMLWPATIPQVSQQTLQQWSKLSFQQVVLEIMKLFIEEAEIPTVELEKMISHSFSRFTKSESANGQTIEEIGLKALAHTQTHSTVHIAELWHGPTLAFKDIPLQFLGQLLNFFLNRKKQKINVLVGTSGDTGSAAIEAVRGSQWLDIFVLYPKGRITEIQELQMVTILDKNVHVVAVEGSSDDLDRPIEQLFAMKEFREEFNLCSINSINVARILMQTAHFFYTYLQLCPQADKEINYCIPTGAAGHIAAGVLSKRMGLPIGKLCAATNQNDTLAKFLNIRPQSTESTSSSSSSTAQFTGGTYTTISSSFSTSSPAMDISVPYNIERVWYALCSGQLSAQDEIALSAEKQKESHYQRTQVVNQWIQAIKEKQSAAFAHNKLTTNAAPTHCDCFSLSEQLQHKFYQFGLCGFSASNQQVKEAIQRIWKQNDYLLDPHTAVGVVAVEQHPELSIATVPTIVFATAHAIKFTQVVADALQLSHEQLNEIHSKSPFPNVKNALSLKDKEQKAEFFARPMDNWTQRLKDLVIQVNQGAPSSKSSQ